MAEACVHAVREAGEQGRARGVGREAPSERAAASNINRSTNLSDNKENTMTPQQKIKHMILSRIATWEKLPAPEFTVEAIDQAWDAAAEDALQDARNEVRTTGIETGLPCEWSRHYESEAVAQQAADGSWVGWTHWYGGGKHSEPEAIDWIEGAYDVDCTEEQKMVTVRTFTKPA
jgi:hypothetical protein